MTASQTLRFAALGTAVAALSLALSSTPAAARATTVGDAAVVVERVTGVLPDKIRTLAIADDIFENEQIQTGPASATRINLQNGASLTVGANSGVTITSAGSDTATGAPRVVLNTTLGVFKFESPTTASATYEIHTPVAKIVARDAVFAMLIDADGTTTVLLDAGELTLTNLVGDSLTMGTPGLASIVEPPAPGVGQAPPSQPGLSPQTATAKLEAMNRAVSKFSPPQTTNKTDTGVAEMIATAPEPAAIDEEALARFAEMFAETDGSPEAIADLAEKLIGELDDDPLETAETAVLIGEAASRALDVHRLAPVVIADGFTLPPRSIGWDFGPDDSPLQPGFRRITPNSLKGHGKPLRGVQFATGDSLMSDGIMNVGIFNAAARNGTYRLIVLTTNFADQASGARPLGHTILVNDTPVRVARLTPADGDRIAHLAGPEVQTADLSGDIYGRSEPTDEVPDGIMTVLTIDVTTGGFTVSLLSEDDEDTFVAGLILEPIEEPSALGEEDVLGERVLVAEAKIANAIGTLLEEVAAAAGDPVTRRRIFNIPEPPPIQDVVAASDS